MDRHSVSVPLTFYNTFFPWTQGSGDCVLKYIPCQEAPSSPGLFLSRNTPGLSILYTTHRPLSSSTRLPLLSFSSCRPPSDLFPCPFPLTNTKKNDHFTSNYVLNWLISTLFTTFLLRLKHHNLFKWHSSPSVWQTQKPHKSLSYAITQKDNNFRKMFKTRPD